jgi:hypothetical protein
MPGAQVAVADYRPAWWPTSTQLLIRQVALDTDQTSSDPRAHIGRLKSSLAGPAACTRRGKAGAVDVVSEGAAVGVGGWLAAVVAEHVGQHPDDK